MEELEKYTDEELEKYTDEELDEILLKEWLIDDTIRYYTIIKSGIIARRILEDNNQKYFDYHLEFKASYLILKEYTKKRNIIVPEEVKYVDITYMDVIERLKESEALYIALIRCDASNYNVDINIRIKEIEDIYEEIINNLKIYIQYSKSIH